MRIKASIGMIGAVLLVAGLGSIGSPVIAAPTTAYSSIPAVLTANVPSVGFQATQTNEFGDLVGLAGVGPTSKLKSVSVVMSSWACKSGTWNANNCVSPTKKRRATFSVPITLNVYAVDNSGPLPVQLGLLATRTQTFKLYLRPSANNAHCVGADLGKWWDAATSTCNNGLAQTITFKLPQGTPVDSDVIWTVSYNTTSYGPSPIGTGAPCFSTPQGCPYDALNVGVKTFPGAPFVGTDTDPDGVFMNSNTAANYCDGGAGGTGTLRDDTGPGCWTGFTPLAEIKIS